MINWDERWGDRGPSKYKPEWNPPLPERRESNYEERMKWQYPEVFTRHLIPEGYHGRWELLTLEDFCFLNSCGISTL